MPTDVELQKLTPCGEAAVVGDRPGVAGGAGNRWPCSVLALDVTPGTAALGTVATQGDGVPRSLPK